MASTADGTVPWPVSRMTSVSGWAALCAGEDLQAVHVVHHQVGDDGVEVLFLDDPGAVAAGGGHAAVETGPPQALGHGFGVGSVVVDDQDLDRGRRRAVAPLSAPEAEGEDEAVIPLMIPHRGGLEPAP